MSSKTDTQTKEPSKIKKQTSKNGNKKLKKSNLHENKNKTDSDRFNSDSDEDLEHKISKDDIQYNMPKPGPHAKAGEWRKWKMMKRTIRQEREEIRMIKRQKIEEKMKVDAELKLQEPEVKKGRDFTLSIAIPGSIMGKVQSKELKTYVAGQIGRAATLFCIDEIIVYNEYAIDNKLQNENNEQLIKILEYLECPQYLRKVLFPPHRYLEHVGLLIPLEAPHHFKLHDDWDFREGVVTDIPTKDEKGSWVDIGLLNKIQIDKKLQAGLRVTVKKEQTSSGKLKGLVVSPETPRVENGEYWGYQVRYANAFRKILYESSFKGAYDLKIGINLVGNKLCLDHIGQLPNAKRILVVFGGLNSIEAAIEADEKLRANKLEQIFSVICESDNNKHFYGSRSVRLEEALLISLAVLRPKILESRSLPEMNSVSDNGFDNDEQNDSDDDDQEKFADVDDSEDSEDVEEEEESENGANNDKEESENENSDNEESESADDAESET